MALSQQFTGSCVETRRRSLFDVVFINRAKTAVGIHWMDRNGKPKPYGEIAAGKRKRQQTRPGAVWLITDDANKPLGHFVVGDRTAQAVISSLAK